MPEQATRSRNFIQNLIRGEFSGDVAPLGTGEGFRSIHG